MTQGLISFPLYTENFSLHSFSLNHASQFLEAIEETREELEKKFHWAHAMHTLQDIEKFFHLLHEDSLRKSLVLFVFKEDQLVGGCSLYLEGTESLLGDLVCWCRSSQKIFEKIHEKMMEEAIEALTLYSFKELKIKRLRFLCRAVDLKEIQVVESLGFKKDQKTLWFLANEKTERLDEARCYERFDSQGLPKKMFRDK